MAAAVAPRRSAAAGGNGGLLAVWPTGSPAGWLQEPMARQRGEREWQLDFMFQLYVDGRMYEYVKKKERRRRIKAKGAPEARRTKSSDKCNSSFEN